MDRSKLKPLSKAAQAAQEDREPLPPIISLDGFCHDRSFVKPGRLLSSVPIKRRKLGDESSATV